MIIACLVGGLANQMGIYAAARALAARHNVPLKLDLQKINKDRLRNYELDKLRITAGIASPREIRAVARISPYPLVNKYRRSLARVFPLTEPNVFVERSLIFDENFFHLPDNIYLKGNFPSIRYYERIGELLQEEFQLALPLSAESSRWLDKINDTCSVSLHVRRADYVDNPKTNKFHGALGVGYYETAVQWMRSHLEQPAFFVFSDDLNWAREHIRAQGSEIHYVDCNDARTAYQDFQLMRSCHSHIIANSGFSRWAAYLNRNPRKIVCMPRRWVAVDCLNDEDLAPADWVRIEN